MKLTLIAFAARAAYVQIGREWILRQQQAAQLMRLPRQP